MVDTDDLIRNIPKHLFISGSWPESSDDASMAVFDPVPGVESVLYPGQLGVQRQELNVHIGAPTNLKGGTR